MQSPVSFSLQANAKRRVLFVDDDPAILRTISGMLEDHEHEWDMQFVETGDEALQQVKAWDPHVVVSDFHMPGMDGATLLQQVRLQHPSALRIILSGRPAMGLPTETDESLRYLAKPLKRQSLVDMIEQSMHVESFISDETLRRDIAKLSSLPMLRPAERQLIAEMDKPDASLKKVAEMVECDPGLASMALRYVRAASRAVPTRVERPGQAALMLGFDTLRCLIMAAGSFRGFDARLQPLAEQLAQAGAGVACDTRKQAIKMGADESDQNAAFTAGLLHGIGILVLSAVRPEAVAQWQAQYPGEWPGDQAEIRQFGATYAGAGAYLLSLWGLPSVTVNAVAWHLSPSQGAESVALDALHTVVAQRKAQGVTAVVAGEGEPAGRMLVGV